MGHNLTPSHVEMFKRAILSLLFCCIILISPIYAVNWVGTALDDGTAGCVRFEGGGSKYISAVYTSNSVPPPGMWIISQNSDVIWSQTASTTHTPIDVEFYGYTNGSIKYVVTGGASTSGFFPAAEAVYYNDGSFSESGGWVGSFSIITDPTPTPTPTPAPSWLTANTSICHHAIIEGQPPSGSNFTYHTTLYWFGTSIGNKIQELWTTRDPFYWDFAGSPGTTYFIDVEATGTEYHRANGTFKIKACSNLSPNGTLVPGITPTGGWPTYGPTQPRPGYTTMPTGTQPSGAPTSGPTLNPLPIIPTTMIPIWDVTVPVPIRTPGFWSTPEDQPINPIDFIITIIDDIIDFFNNLPDNLWDIFNYPDRDDLLNLVNSTLIPDSILEDYFDFWDQILSPIIEALHFILAVLEMPLELLNTVLDYLKEILDGVFNEIINILKGAEFFFKWIFYVIPEPLLWMGLALMVLILIMKVLHS